MTKMVKIAILTTLASLYACSLDSVSDIRSADSAIDDPFDKVATPQPITGSFLTYDNARIYCNPSSGEGSLEFQVQCHAAIMDTITGKEVLALGIAKDTAIQWSPPTVVKGSLLASIECDSDNNNLSYLCKVALVESKITTLKWDLIISQLNKKKTESDEVTLPYSIQTFGFVPELPRAFEIEKPKDPNLSAKLKLGDKEMTPTRFGFQALEIPAIGYNTLYINDMCMSEGSIFMLGGDFVYEYTGSNIVTFAGSASSANVNNFSHRLRTKFKSPRGINCKSKDEILVYDAQSVANQGWRILKIHRSGAVSVVASGDLEYSWWGGSDNPKMFDGLAFGPDENSVYRAMAGKLTKHVTGKPPVVIDTYGFEPPPPPPQEGEMPYAFPVGVEFDNYYQSNIASVKDKLFFIDAACCIKSIDKNGKIEIVVPKNFEGFNFISGENDKTLGVHYVDSEGRTVTHASKIVVDKDENIYLTYSKNQYRKVDWQKKTVELITLFENPGNDYKYFKLIGVMEDGSYLVERRHEVYKTKDGKSVQIAGRSPANPWTHPESIPGYISQLDFYNEDLYLNNASLTYLTAYYISDEERQNFRVPRLKKNETKIEQLTLQEALPAAYARDSDGQTYYYMEANNDRAIFRNKNGVGELFWSANYNLKSLKKSYNGGFIAHVAGYSRNEIVWVNRDGIAKTLHANNGFYNSEIGFTYPGIESMQVDSRGKVYFINGKLLVQIDIETNTSKTILDVVAHSVNAQLKNSVYSNPPHGIFNLSVSNSGIIYLLDLQNDVIWEGIDRDGDGPENYVFSKMFGGNEQVRDCGSGIKIEGKSKEQTFENKLSASIEKVCVGQLTAVTSKDNCSAEGGTIEIAIAQHFTTNNFNSNALQNSSILKIEKPCKFVLAVKH